MTRHIPPTLTPERRAELRKLAEAATPGKRDWQHWHDPFTDLPKTEVRHAAKRFIDGKFVARVANLDNAAHIAAWDRETCLTLLAERDALAEQVAKMRAALERIERMEVEISWLGEEFYGHGAAIARAALAECPPVTDRIDPHV